MTKRLIHLVDIQDGWVNDYSEPQLNPFNKQLAPFTKTHPCIPLHKKPKQKVKPDVEAILTGNKDQIEMRKKEDETG